MAGGGAIAKLFVELGAKTTEFDRKMTASQSKMQKFGKGATAAGQSLMKGLTLPLAVFGAVALRNWDKQATAIAGVEAALKSTGNTAGKTIDELVKSAGKLQKTSLYGDETILQEVTANLLTFTKVHGEVFDRAQQTIVDFSARTKRDLIGSTMMFGKALNDPIMGLTAMSRAGVQFTESQKEMVKGLVASNRVVDAQVILLNELEVQFGGAAAAAAKAGLGPFKQLLMTLGDVSERFGKVIGEALMPMVEWLHKVALKLENADASTIRWYVTIGTVLAVIPVLISALGSLASTFYFVSVAVAAMSARTKEALIGTGWGIAIVAIGTAALVIMNNWAKVGPFFKTLWDGFVLMTTKAIDAVLSAISQLFSWIPGAETAIAVARAKLSNVINEQEIARQGGVFQRMLAEITADAVARHQEMRDSAAKGGMLPLPDPAEVARLEAIVDEYEKLSQGIQNLQHEKEVLGEKSDLEAGMVKILESAMISLLNLGVKPAEEGYKNLKAALDAWRLSAAQAANPTKPKPPDPPPPKVPTSLPNLPSDDPTKKWMGGSLEAARDWATEMEMVIADGMGEAAGAFLEGVGKMAAGQASLGDVFRMVLSTLADLAIRVGKIAIKTGLAIGGIRKALESLNPAIAIAAGAALIVLGSWVKSSLGGVASGMGGGGGGGGGMAGESTSIGNYYAPPVRLDRVTHRSRANDVESGATFSRDDTFRRIASDIAQSLSGQGIRVEIVPQSLPSGDIEYSIREGERRALRRGTEVF